MPLEEQLSLFPCWFKQGNMWMVLLLLEAVLLEEKLNFRERAAKWICSPGTLQLRPTLTPTCSLHFSGVSEYKSSLFLKLVWIKNTCNINHSNAVSKNNCDEQRCKIVPQPSLARELAPRFGKFIENPHRRTHWTVENAGEGRLRISRFPTSSDDFAVPSAPSSILFTNNFWSLIVS